MTSPPTDRRVTLIASYLNGNLQHACSSSALAQFVNLSASRLRHLFKAKTGHAPTQYIKALRLQKAAELLATTNLSAKQIRYQVGLADKKHFAQYFKKAFGLTPSEYRKRCPPPNSIIAGLAPQ